MGGPGAVIVTFRPVIITVCASSHITESLMRKPAFAASVVVAATALLAGVTAVPASANTVKEMKVCWTSPANTNYGIHVALDGPTSRSAVLANGQCMAWDVKPGDYKVVWADLDTAFDRTTPNYSSEETYQAYVNALSAYCGVPADTINYGYLDPKASVKRFHNIYGTRELNNSGIVRTTVQKNRQTKVNFRMYCQLNNNFG